MSCDCPAAEHLHREIERLREALGQIAGQWHAHRLDGERFGCSCPEFAREALKESERPQSLRD